MSFLKNHKKAGLRVDSFFEPAIFDLLKDDSSVLELEILDSLAVNNQLMAYRHRGFWQPIDTMREKQLLEKLCFSKTPPWKNWK